MSAHPTRSFCNVSVCGNALAGEVFDLEETAEFYEGVIEFAPHLERDAARRKLDEVITDLR